MFYLIIAYDITSDKRRNKIAKLLKSYGERRQYSLFEARLNREQLSQLKVKLNQLIDETEDTLAMYYLSPENLKKTWRIGHEAIRQHSEPDFVWMGLYGSSTKAAKTTKVCYYRSRRALNRFCTK